MGTIATLTVNLAANSAKFAKELSKSRKQSKTWAKSVRSNINSVSKAAVAMGVAAGAAFTAMVNNQANDIDKIAKQSAKLGLAGAELQKLRYQAELSGVSSQKLDMSLQRMTRRVSEAATGTGEAVKALKELGLDAEKLAKLSPEKQFNAVADAMKGIGNQGDKVRLAMKLFDSEGVDLVNTLNSNLKETGKEFDSLGIALTQQQLAIAEAYNDSKTKLGKIWDGFAKQMTVQTAPYFQAFTDWMSESIESAGGLGVMVSKSMTFAAKAVGVIADAFWGLKAVIKVIQGTFAQFMATILKGSHILYETIGELGDAVGADFVTEHYKKASDFAGGMSEAFKKQADEAFSYLDTKAPSIEIEARIKKANEEIDKAMSSKLSKDVDAASKSVKELALSAQTASDRLSGKESKERDGADRGALRRKEGKHYDWKFASYGRALEGAKYTGNQRDITYYTEQMKQLIDNRKKSAYHADWDIEGMEQLFKRLGDQATENLGEINLNLKTDSGTVSGTVKGDAGFMKDLAASLKQAAQVTA